MKNESFSDRFHGCFKLCAGDKERNAAQSDVRSFCESLLRKKLNPVLANETFGTFECQICVKERIELKKIISRELENFINKETRVEHADKHKNLTTAFFVRC